MLTSFTALIARDLKRCLLRNGQTMMSLYVFMMLMVFFPLTLHPSQFDLPALSPALTWVSLFLAAQLPLDRLFLDDYKNGSLTLWTFTPAPIEVIVLAKLIVAWLSMAFPLVITAVLTGTFFYQWPLAAFFTNALVLILGSILITLLSVLAICITLGGTSGKAMLYFITMPLAVPSMIFGAAALQTTTTQVEATPLIILALILLATCIPLLWASSYALLSALQDQ